MKNEKTYCIVPKIELELIFGHLAGSQIALREGCPEDAEIEIDEGLEKFSKLDKQIGADFTPKEKVYMKNE